MCRGRRDPRAVGANRETCFGEICFARRAKTKRYTGYRSRARTHLGIPSRRPTARRRQHAASRAGVRAHRHRGARRRTRRPARAATRTPSGLAPLATREDGGLSISRHKYRRGASRRRPRARQRHAPRAALAVGAWRDSLACLCRSTLAGRSAHT